MFSTQMNIDSCLLDASFPKLDIYPHQSQHERVIDLFHQLMKPKRVHKDSVETFSWLVANLGTRNTLIIPMSPTYWSSKRKELKVSQKVPDFVNIMKKPDYVVKDTGCETWESATRVRATDKFHTYFDGQLFIDYKPRTWITVQEWEYTGEKRRVYDLVTKKYKAEKVFRKKILPCASTPETRETERVLTAYYNLTRRHSIELNKTPLVTALRRIYSKDLEHGGRFYSCHRYGFQSINRIMRKDIFIDDDVTTEYDFASLHINMLRAKEWLRPIEDAYLCILDQLPVHDNERYEIRQFLKVMLQSILNSKSMLSSEQSGGYTINYIPLLSPYYEDHERVVRRILKRINVTVSDIVALFESRHSQISKYFYSSIGTELQYMDSQITMRIIEYFTRKRDIVLPIHDSYIVRRASQGDLKVIMNDAYRKIINTPYECPIK